MNIVGITELCEEIHTKNLQAGWWNDPSTGELLTDNPYVLATKLCLIHSETSEALEGLRKGKQDSHLPQYPEEAVELADIFIRLFDYCGVRGFDMDEIIQAKLDYNAQRADHKVENRVKSGGKKF